MARNIDNEWFARLGKLSPSLQMDEALRGMFPKSPEVNAFNRYARKIREDASVQLSPIQRMRLRGSYAEADKATRVFSAQAFSRSPEDIAEATVTATVQAVEVYSSYEEARRKKLKKPITAFQRVKLANTFLTDLRETVESNQGISPTDK